MTFEPARPGDAVAILRIFKATFEPDLLPYLPMGCSGAQAYIEDIITTEIPHPDTIWFVARDSAIRAFAEFRLSFSGLFINWLHVDPAAQGQKIGSKLFLHALETLSPNHDQSITLDVAEHNSRASAWYRRLGFVDEHTTSWRLFPLQPGLLPQPFLISVNASDELMHKTYGFSTRKISTASGAFNIGLLSDHCFRSTDPSDLERTAILQAIDPQRQLLLITHHPVQGGREISRRVRMTASTQTVLKNLRGE